MTCKKWGLFLYLNVFASELQCLKGCVQKQKGANFYIIDGQSPAPLDRMNMLLSSLQQTNMTMANHHVEKEIRNTLYMLYIRLQIYMYRYLHIYICIHTYNTL